MKFTRIGNYDGIEIYGASTIRGNYSIIFEDNHYEASYKSAFHFKPEVFFKGTSWTEAETACKAHYRQLMQ